MKRILILLLVITGLYIVFNQAYRFDIFGTSSEGNKNGQAAISTDVQVIKVDVSSVSTTIIPEDRIDLKAVYNGKQQLKVSENGDTVAVSVKSKGFNFFDWTPFTEKSKLTIYIPKDYDRNMTIDLGSGNLHFSGQSKENPMKLNEVTIDIGSGNMDFKNLLVKRWSQDIGSGNVKIDSLRTETGTFDLSSGNMDIKHYMGAMEADVSSGRLNIQMDKLTDSIKIDVSSGNVGLDLPDQADFTLTSDVSSGNISCDFPLTTKEVSKHSIQGKHGSGKYKIDLDVSSGNVKIH